jgi:hypothetical protein
MENGTYNMEQLSQQFTLQLTPGNRKKRDEGERCEVQ